jgi:hypothetical protein
MMKWEAYAPGTTFLHDMKKSVVMIVLKKSSAKNPIGNLNIDVKDVPHGWIRLRLSKSTLGVKFIASPTTFRFSGNVEAIKSVHIHSLTGDSVPTPHVVDEKIDIDYSILYDTPDSITPGALMSQLCRQFYDLGWVTGTGGSISIRHGSRYYMSPSGIQKERMKHDDMFVVNRNGDIISSPKQHPHRPRLTLSQCSPLFLKCFNLRGAHAAIHTHSMDAAMLTQMLGDDCTEFRVSHQEMIKGIVGHEFYSTLVVPIVCS